MDALLRDVGRVRLVRDRAAARGDAEQAGDGSVTDLPLAARDSVCRSGVPLAARLAGTPERRLRRREPVVPHQHPLVVRPVEGAWLGDLRQRLADGAVFLPRLARGAAVNSW